MYSNQTGGQGKVTFPQSMKMWFHFWGGNSLIQEDPPGPPPTELQTSTGCQTQPKKVHQTRMARKKNYHQCMKSVTGMQTRLFWNLKSALEQVTREDDQTHIDIPNNTSEMEGPRHLYTSLNSRLKLSLEWKVGFCWQWAGPHCPVSLTMDKWKAWLQWAGDEALTALGQSVPQGLGNNDKRAISGKQEDPAPPQQWQQPKPWLLVASLIQKRPNRGTNPPLPNWKTANLRKNLTRREKKFFFILSRIYI